MSNTPVPARRAEQRSTEQRDLPERAIRTRQRSVNTDPFYIDPIEVPPGTSWEWKRSSNLGAEDTEHQISMLEAGWEPVTWEMRNPGKRPPGLTAIGLKDPCKRKGMILMERPLELTQEAQIEMRQAAQDQVMDKMRALGQAPPDTFSRDHRNLDNHVKREYAPAGIPVAK